MILIADSGSSKTDWRILAADGTIRQAQTIGFNPFYQSQKQLDTDIREVLLPQIGEDISSIFYYGAGCSTENNRKVIRDVLQKYFDNAHIEVWHDLLAAARSLCGDKPGIACIIGTGVNSCYYDGDKIVKNVSSLGYILGDEGSGSHLGRQLVADYMRKDLPQEIWDRFLKRYDLNRDQILEKVYQGEMPGRFLASFSKFIFQNIKHPYCHRLVYDSFKSFFEKNVMKYEGYDKVPIHFTGSVAFYFNNILRQVAGDLSIMMGNVIESPIAGLTLFHQKSISN